MSNLQETLSLLGVFPNPDEAQSHLEQITGDGIYNAQEAKDLWHRSREAYAPVHETPGFPTIAELPSTTWKHLLRLQEHKSFSAMTGGFRWSVRLVEIDPLLTIATNVSVPRIDQWADRFQKANDWPAQVELCLPRTSAPLPIQGSAQTLFAVHSDLGATWGVNPSQGLGISIVLPPLGVRAVENAGRLFLFDGYHRAVALRRLGHIHVPCLILHDGTWGFLRTTPRQPRFEPPPFERPDPPCVGHFLSPAAVPTRAQRQVRVMTVRSESFIANVADVSPPDRKSGLPPTGVVQ